jgi:hypothetical protein
LALDNYRGKETIFNAGDARVKIRHSGGFLSRGHRRADGSEHADHKKALSHFILLYAEWRTRRYFTPQHKDVLRAKVGFVTNISRPGDVRAGRKTTRLR